jgi:hypothetical protein
MALWLAGCGGTVVFEEPGEGGAPADILASGTTVGVTTSAGGGGDPGPGPASTSVTTGPSDGICESGVSLFDGAEDGCLEASCCDAFQACAEASSVPCDVCIDDGGTGPTCEPALRCAADSGCFTEADECSTGLSFGDPVIDSCLESNCCVEGLLCIQGGQDVAGCAECLQAGGGDRCIALLLCGNDSGCLISQGICDSGLTTNDIAIDACLTTSCCEPFVACTAFGTDAQACIDCLLEGGGPLCDDAIACDQRAGCGLF